MSSDQGLGGTGVLPPLVDTRLLERVSRYCQAEGRSLVRLDERSCSVEMPRDARAIASFLARSPVQTKSEPALITTLSGLVDDEGLRLVEFDGWKLSAEPLGGIPPNGGMLRLTFTF